jgi:hypothetical protein
MAAKEESWLPLLTTQSTESSRGTKRSSEALQLKILRAKRKDRERELARLEVTVQEMERQRRDEAAERRDPDLNSLERDL